MDQPIYPELGFYALPGHISEPRDIYDEIEAADRVGLGSVWISERLNTKNVEVLSGLAAAKTSRMGIASGLLANMPLRHPLVTAGYASTMALLTDNRFALGVGRGFDYIRAAAGIPKSTFQVMEDYITIMRQLWRGEAVDYSGPLGVYRGMRLGAKLETPPPIIMAVMGDKTSHWAGRFCDGVVYNSLWSTKAVEHSTRIVRQGAIEAGRDPDSVKVWTILVTASDATEEAFLNTIIRRLNTYILVPYMFDDICDANGWDKSVPVMLRAELSKFDRAPQDGMHKDEHTTRDLEHLRRMADLYPQAWLDEGHAVGTARHCLDKVLERFDAGADGVLFHGTHPAALQSFMDIWPEHRPKGVFDGRAVNPGV
jgi:5,10-methylenetetrahydromethanopterin reductase